MEGEIKMEKKYNQLTKIILLGLLPLITGTYDMITALMFAGTLIFTALIVRLFSKIISEDYFLWGIGFAIVSFLYFLIPEVNIYYVLIGVTPLVYYNHAQSKWLDFFNNSILFLFFMILISVLREITGYGSLLGYSLLDNPLFEISRKPAGALLILGTTGLLIEVLYNRFNIFKKITNSLYKKDREKEVTS